MAQKLLGMYVHMHWGYNHPYAARTWTLDDWRAYLRGIAGLGYNLLQIWPMVDTMPLPLTPSDVAHLEKMRRVIDLARREFNMTVWVTLCANTLGNSKAALYTFESRPYFATERLINPADAAERRELMEARRIFLEPLKQADGFSIIDSDPGKYEGSTVEDFIRLLADHRQLLDSLRPGLMLNYWMWAGWGCWDTAKVTEKEQFASWREALRGLQALDAEPWGVLACWPQHFRVVEEMGLQARALYFPYGVIEGEPTFPLTNCDVDKVWAAFARVDSSSYPRGAMGNAQTHCLQLPHTYFFAQFARGYGPEAISLAEFAEELIPGLGHRIAEAWQALSGDDSQRIAAARDRLRAAFQCSLQEGRLGGLLLGDPVRFLDDLIAQLNWKTSLIGLEEALRTGRDVLPKARELALALESWAARHGFRDYYGGPFREMLHPLLAKLADFLPHGDVLKAALAEFEALEQGHVPERHGAFARLFQSFQASLS